MTEINRYRRIAILVLLGFALGCDPSNGSEDALKSLTGEKLQVIKCADSAVVKRIETKLGVEKSLSDFQPLAGEQLEKLQILLANTDSFGWGYAKDCTFVPGVLVVLSKGSVKSEVRICFECMQVGFTPGHLEDVDPVEQELIDWAKSVFPNDDTINSLKPN